MTERTDSSDQYVNSLAFLNPEDGAAIEYTGPFLADREGGQVEIAVPIGERVDKEIRPETAENLAEREGDIAVALADGGVHASGRIKACDRIEKELLVAIDDPTVVSPSGVDFER